MSTQHTPGPWQAVEWSCHAKTTIRAGDVTVAECSGHGRYASECLADARLIAAAPDLLEALQVMVKQFTKVPSTYLDSKARGMAHAAIAKATGEAA